MTAGQKTSLHLSYPSNQHCQSYEDTNDARSGSLLQTIDNSLRSNSFYSIMSMGSARGERKDILGIKVLSSEGVPQEYTTSLNPNTKSAVSSLNRDSVPSSFSFSAVAAQE